MEKLEIIKKEYETCKKFYYYYMNIKKISEDALSYCNY